MIPYQTQAYGSSNGSVPVSAFLFESRDPTPNDTTPKVVLYSAWVNVNTKAIWYLEEFLCSNAVITSQWRAVGPIVTSTINPTTSDYLYPIGQTWINTVAQSYWGLVNVTGVVATWIDLTAGAATGLLTLTGNVGGAVGYDMSRNINILGATNQVVVTGTPLDNTLTISLAGGAQAIDSVAVDEHTAPGTDPVVPNTDGEITVTGGQIDAASTVNVIQTNSLAANTYTIQVQRSKTEMSSTVGSNGVCHFDSSDFNVDNNGFVSSNSFNSITTQGFSSPGTFTYTPTSGMRYCIVELWGAGGGGGGAKLTGVSEFSCGGGGGAGGYSRSVFSAATIGASQSVTVGAGGIAVSGDVGGTGGTTSFGALFSATGGVGGFSPAASMNTVYGQGAAGGSGVGGDIDSSASFGSYGIVGSAVNYGGRGGNSPLGNGGEGSNNQTTGNGAGATGFAAGGGGGANLASQSATSGGAGSDGLISITEYIG